MSEHYELTLGDYLAIAKRRWLFLLVPFVVISLASVIAALWAPPVYKSTGTILIESQRISDDFIRSTITTYADERIQVIQQLVMTRKNLLRIIEKFNLFAKVRDQLTISEQIDLMRERIEIAKVRGDSSRGRRQSSTVISFTVGFEDRNPALAYAGANELVTLFLEENVKARTERASETTEFLGLEANKLKHDLEVIEEQIASYKQENIGALPEHLNLHMKMLERTEASIRDTDRDIKSAQGDIRFLEIELAAVNVGAMSSGGQPTIATPVQALANAEAELAALQSRYSDKHPDMQRLQNQIATFKAEAAEAGLEDQDSDAGNVVTAQNFDSTRLQAKMAVVNERINSLVAQRTQLDSSRNRLEATIIQMPQVQRALVSLNRDYENTLLKYKEIQGNEMAAQLAESLERGKKAERFSLLEPPIKPEKPIRPNRGKIMVMGIFLAIGASLALTILLEAGDKRIWGADALTALMKEQPLVAIPYITTADELQRYRRTQMWLLATGLLAALVIPTAVHIFYMPLDLLLIKIMARLG